MASLAQATASGASDTAAAAAATLTRRKIKPYDKKKQQQSLSPEQQQPSREIQNGFRFFLQPYETPTLLRGKGEILRDMRQKYGLYTLMVSKFIHISAARSLKMFSPGPPEQQAAQISGCITELYSHVLKTRANRDATGVAIPRGTGVLRFAVTNSVAAHFNTLIQELAKPARDSSPEIHVTKTLIPNSPDQLILVNVSSPKDMEFVKRFVHKLVLVESTTPLKPSDFPRAHILPPSDDHVYPKSTDRGSGKKTKAGSGAGPYKKIKLVVPQYMVGTVIGKGGESIKELRKNTGAFITVLNKNGDNKTSKPNYDKKDLTQIVEIVSEDEANVMAAAEGIKDRLEDEWYSDKSRRDIERIFTRANLNI